MTDKINAPVDGRSFNVSSMHKNPKFSLGRIVALLFFAIQSLVTLWFVVNGTQLALDLKENITIPLAIIVILFACECYAIFKKKYFWSSIIACVGLAVLLIFTALLAFTAFLGGG